MSCNKKLSWGIALTLASAAASAQTQLYVSPWGNDSWSGTLSAPNTTRTDGPKATIGGARDQIRALKTAGTLSAAGAIVEIADGRYVATTPIEFTSKDSGTSSAPIVYRAQNPSKAIIDGSVPVVNWTKPSADLLARIRPEAQPYVLAADLKALGVQYIGGLPISHWTGNKNNIPSSYIELYENGARQTIARWPNGGYATVRRDGTNSSFETNLTTARIVDGDPNVQIYSFAAGLYWAYQGVPITTNHATSTITTGTPLSYPSKMNGKFFLRNSLEELDQAGEYYVDPNTWTLLWYPGTRQNPASCRIAINGNDEDGARRLVLFNGVSNVTLQGVTVTSGRGDGVIVQNCDNVDLIGLSIRKMGGYGAKIAASTNCIIDSSFIDDMGEGGVQVDGGDLMTITSGNNAVQNCRISNFGRITPGYRAGILLAGVGNRASHNDITDGPQCAMLVQGNELLIEDNYIARVCKDTSDAGAVYVSGVVQYRGNTFRGNLLEDVRNKVDSGGIWGIYLDARASHAKVVDNICRRVGLGFICNAGRNNWIENNISQDCDWGYQFDDRSHIAYAGLDALNNYPIGKGIWQQKYPELTTLLADSPTYAKYDVFYNNAALNCTSLVLWKSLKVLKVPTLTPTGLNDLGWVNMIFAPSGLFTGEQSGDYTPVPGSALALAGFRPLSDKTQGVQGNEFITGRINNGTP
jgi:hypothetical protein